MDKAFAEEVRLGGRRDRCGTPVLRRWTRRVLRAIGPLLLSGAIGTTVGAHAQEQEGEPERVEIGALRELRRDAPAALPATTEDRRRPSFMLPDVVIEGEDTRRLGGGVRLLDLSVPGVAPEQRPVTVAPPASGYQRRTRSPLRIELPAPPSRDLLRGYSHLSGDSRPGGRLALAVMPRVAGPTLLWCDVRGWDQRLDATARGELGAGIVTAREPLRPDHRFGLGVGGGLLAWDDLSEPVAGETLRGGEQRFLAAHGLWQQRARPLGLDGVVGVRGRLGHMRTRYDAATATSQSLAREGRWASLQVSWATEDRGPNQRVVRGAELPAAAARGGRSPRLLAEARSAVVWRRNPADSSHAGVRGDGLLGVDLGFPGGRLGVGLAGGGDEESQTLGPYVSVEHAAADGARVLRLEAAPCIGYADEMLLGEETFMPGGRDHPSRLHHRLEYLAVTGSELVPTFAAGPQPIGGAPRWPRSALGDPLQAAHVAWPRVTGELLVRGGGGEIQLAALAAWLDQPLAWVPQGAQFVAGEDSLPPAYHLANAADRRLLGLQVDVAFSLSAQARVRCRYAWSHDELRDSEEALAFVAEHEGWIGLEGALGSLLWMVSAHARSEAPAGGNLPALDAFVDLSTTIGWRFGDGRLFCRVANLLGDDVRVRPGDGADEPWVRLGWEQSFYAAAP